jgi:two-component system sensor histidine kinase KdpD
LYHQNAEEVNLLTNRPKKIQYLISTSLVVLIATFCFLLSDLVGYQVAALLLLVTVSVLAMFFEITPVLVAAILSALIWDFFFIPPRFTFTVGTTEDRILLFTYFIIVSLHAVLTSRIRQVQRLAQKKEERAKQLKFYNTLFNSLSHELRTPITTIMAATDNLQADSLKLTPESKTMLLQEITIASTRLNRQVENLLSMSRLESGVIQIRKDWCDVRELIYTTLQAFDAFVINHRVTVFVCYIT